MAINPPSLPTTPVRSDAYIDDSSLALQSISAEQGILGLQTVSNISQLLENSIIVLRNSVESSVAISNATQSIQRDEASQARGLASSLASAIANEAAPANSAALEAFLQSRGLPSDLSTQAGRQAAFNALNSYANQVENDFASVDNAGIRARIAGNATLQAALDDANNALTPPAERLTPADLLETQARLNDVGVRLRGALVDQLREIAIAATQSIQSVTFNNQLGTELGQALRQIQNAIDSRVVVANQDLARWTSEFNFAIRDVSALQSAEFTIDEIGRLGDVLDRLNTTVDRLREGFLTQATTSVSASYAADLLARIRASQNASSGSSNQDAPNSPPAATRLREPSRFV